MQKAKLSTLCSTALVFVNIFCYDYSARPHPEPSTKKTTQLFMTWRTSNNLFEIIILIRLGSMRSHNWLNDCVSFHSPVVLCPV